MTLGGSQEPVRKLTITVERVSFLYWYFTSIKGLFLFAFFQGNPALGTVLVAALSGGIAYFLVLVVGKTPRSLWIRALPFPAKVLIVFIIWSAISLTWTHAESRFVAASYWLMMTLDVFIVYRLACSATVERVATSSLGGLIWGSASLGLVALIMSLGNSSERLGDANFLHPNILGNQLAIACMCSLYFVLNPQRKRWCWQLSTVFLFFILLLTLSKTSILAFILAAMVFVFSSRLSPRKKLGLFSLLLGVTLLSSVMILDYLSQYLFETQGGQALDTVSGRTIIWAATWELIQSKLMQGYGFLAYKDFGPAVAQNLQLVQAHNEALQLLFTLGMIGLGIAVVAYVAFYVSARRAAKDPAKRPQAILGIALLAYCLIHSLTEASTTGLVFPLPLLLIMILWMGIPLPSRSPT